MWSSPNFVFQVLASIQPLRSLIVQLRPGPKKALPLGDALLQHWLGASHRVPASPLPTTIKLEGAKTRITFGGLCPLLSTFFTQSLGPSLAWHLGTLSTSP